MGSLSVAVMRRASVGLLVAVLATAASAQVSPILFPREADAQKLIDYLQVTYYSPTPASSLPGNPYPLFAPTLSPSPSPAWQVFGGLDSAGRYVGWAGGAPARLTRLALFPAIPDEMFVIYARVQAYYGPTLRWDYYIQRWGGWQFVMDIAFWRDESNVWMEVRWDNDANAVADVPVEDPGLLNFLNSPVARVVAPPVPEPALVQMGALSALGALGLVRLRRKA